jgi:diguanylate cyclase (GGDEF)-like protein
MEQEPDVPRDPQQSTPQRTHGALYAASVLAIAAALASEFFIAYQLLLDHPGHARQLAGQTYAALAFGLLVLAAQAVLVYGALIRRVADNSAEIAQLKTALEQHCHHDELTKALNRMAFDHMIVREMEHLKRYGVALCGIMADVDGFRAVNEKIGYEAGDLVLAELAQLLKKNIRKADCLFRWRSGRFLVLAIGLDAEQCRHFAEKLRQVVAATTFRQGVRLSVTLGVAQATAEDSPETFIARVKTALSLAKDQGRALVADA